MRAEALVLLSGLILGCGAPAEETTPPPGSSDAAGGQISGGQISGGQTSDGTAKGAQPPADEPTPAGITTAEKVARVLPGPDFELLGLDGEHWSLGDLRGRVVLINFWATWCTSCRGEMPELDELHAEFGDQGVTILGIATDRDPDRVAPYIADLGVEYPILLDPKAVSTAIFGGVEGYPKTFILDQDGLVYSSYLGAMPKAVFAEDLLYLLAAPPSPAAPMPDSTSNG